VLEKQGVDPDAVADARIIVAELFANALNHHLVYPGEQVGVVVREVLGMQGSWIRIGVVDEGSGTINRSHTNSPATAENGRGLNVVHGLGARLGDDCLPGGYLVTATFPADTRVRVRVCRCSCASLAYGISQVCQIVVDPEFRLPEALRDVLPGPVCQPCVGHLGTLESIGRSQGSPSREAEVRDR